LDQNLDRGKYEIILSKDFGHVGDAEWEAAGVRVIRSDISSIGKQFAVGLGLSRGSVIAFLDDGDVWKKERLSKVYSVSTNDASIGYYHNGIFFIDERGKEVCLSPDRSSSITGGKEGNRDYAGELLRWRGFCSRRFLQPQLDSCKKRNYAECFKIHREG